MNSSFACCTVFLSVICYCTNICSADSDNLRDTCPTSPPGKQHIFINGFPCKNPNDITAPDFKSSELTKAGNTENYPGSSVNLVTAAELPGLNTLGLSIARTDLRVDGLVMLHSHPRSSELLFVSEGSVLVGFIDTRNKPFQKVLNEGDVFVFPRGLLHFCLNAGFDSAAVFSVFNSQNPGMVGISGAMLESDHLEMIDKLTKGFITDHVRNATKLNPII